MYIQNYNIANMGLDKVKGTTFIGLTYETTQRTKVEFKDRVTKRTSTRAIICNSKKTNFYENMVNKRLRKEKNVNQFKASPAVWGDKTSTCFTTHTKDDTTKHYLKFIVMGEEKVQYFLDGNPISEDYALTLVYKSKPKQGGLSEVNEVKYRKVSLENIKRISALGNVIESNSMHYEELPKDSGYYVKAVLNYIDVGVNQHEEKLCSNPQESTQQLSDMCTKYI